MPNTPDPQSGKERSVQDGALAGVHKRPAAAKSCTAWQQCSFPRSSAVEAEDTRSGAGRQGGAQGQCRSQEAHTSPSSVDAGAAANWARAAGAATAAATVMYLKNAMLLFASEVLQAIQASHPMPDAEVLQSNSRCVYTSEYSMHR